MILKKGVLIGTFIADQKHPFFDSDAFHGVLRAVQQQPNASRCTKRPAPCG